MSASVLIENVVMKQVYPFICKGRDTLTDNFTSQYLLDSLWATVDSLVENSHKSLTVNLCK